MPNYAPIPGFDIAKINDPQHVNDKYSPALRAFSEAMAAGIPLTRGNLAPQVDWAKSHGFANAQQVGDDSIDYGDSRGPIDLIRGGDDATMFLDKAVWGPSAASAPPPAANTSLYNPQIEQVRAGGTQDELINQALGNLSNQPPQAPTGADQILGNYDDVLRQQILDQMKGSD